MVGGVYDILTFVSATHLCFVSGILTTKEPLGSQATKTLQSPARSYLPTSTFPKLPQHTAIANRALNNGLEDIGILSSRVVEGQSQVGYSYLKSPSIELKLPSADKKVLLFGSQRISQEKQITHGTTTKTPERFTTSTHKPRAGVAYHPHIPRRSSYQVVEDLDEYLTDDSDHSKLPYRGKAQTTYPHRDSQDITTAIKSLDRFLSGVLNDDSYNSELHPPPNPVLALVLSRYGRYVPGARNPRVYAYMAVNNIHNNKPFGSYKLECEEEPTYVVR